MCIITNSFHVEAGYWFGYIGMRPRLKVLAIVRVPLVITVFYYGMVFQSISRAKINMVLLRYKIVSWRVERVGNDIAIPPGECCFARLDPAYIVDLAGFVQICDNV